MSTQVTADQHTLYRTDLHPSECDFERLIFPHTLLMLGQNAAEKDIELCPSLGRDALEAQEIKWMISSVSYYLTGLRPVKGSQVLSETWSPGIKGINFLRSHLIFSERREATQLVAHGSSRWFLVDRDSRKPLRPYEVVSEEDYKAYCAPDRGLSFRTLRIKPSKTATLYQQDFAIGYSLLDDNYHLNNVNYISLAMDCLWSYFASRDLSLIDYQVREIHCNYVAEVRAGQTLTLSLKQAEANQPSSHACLFQGQDIDFSSQAPTQSWELTGHQKIEDKLDLAFRALIVLEEKS